VAFSDKHGEDGLPGRRFDPTITYRRGREIVDNRDFGIDMQIPSVYTNLRLFSSIERQR